MRGLLGDTHHQAAGKGCGGLGCCCGGGVVGDGGGFGGGCDGVVVVVFMVMVVTICRLCPLVAVLSSGLCEKEVAHDRLNSSENYLLLGFLLAMQSQTVLLLVRQSVT